MAKEIKYSTDARNAMAAGVETGKTTKHIIVQNIK